jgi:hypothetical protein
MEYLTDKGCPSDWGMGLFSARRRSTFPADMIQRLETFGRFEFDARTSGIDSGNIFNDCVAPFFDAALQDPASFCTGLRTVINNDQGGFATFGAARLVWEILGEAALSTPAARPLIEAGLDFKLSRGLSTWHLTGHENQLLHQRREQRG